MRSSRVIKGITIAVELVVMPRWISMPLSPRASEDTKPWSCCQASRFKAQLEGSALDSGRVELTHYDTNELAYRVESARGGVVVFSEIYYPGWTVTIDGKEAELGRVNYVLRALKVPAGKHEVRMEFRLSLIPI